MSVPMELPLRETAEGLRLFRDPAPQLLALRKTSSTMAKALVQPGKNATLDRTGEQLELEMQFQPGEGGKTVISIRGVDVVHDAKTGELTCLGSKALLPKGSGPVKLRIFADRTSIEIFAADGLVYIPSAILFKKENQGITVSSLEGDTQVTL
ncbi:MAG: hypothetical protein EXR99_16720, partial [Gemmataceae bacterium]|nr:hypothetical protein [Gemmataceae bacterium]